MAISISQNSVKYKSSDTWIALNNVLDGVKELPTVSNDDNGKVLKVIDGRWELGDGVTVEGSGGVSADHKHSYLAGWSDTRNNATTPNDYNGKFKITGLKVPEAIGSPDSSRYHSLIGFRGWNDSSGGNAHELAFTGNGNIYHRNGIDVDWSAWRQILDSENYVNYRNNAIKMYGNDTISSTDNDTTAKWGALGISGHFYTKTGELISQPSQWGMLLNIGKDSEVHQIWMTQTNGNMYHRGGNANGWGGTWRTILDSENYSSYCAPASHTHNYAAASHGTHVSYGTSASALGTSSAGSASTVSRSDHVHALPALTSCTGTLTVAKGGTGTTTFTSGAALIGAGTGAVTTRAITNNTTIGYITYNTNLMTTNTLAYWNGAFSSAGASNLKYCSKGAFGSIVTKNTGDYLPIGGGTLTGSVTSSGSFTAGSSVFNASGCIELYGSTPFIDFHYNNSTKDYTSRIIESSSGVLKVNCASIGTEAITISQSNATTRAFFKVSNTLCAGSFVASTDGYFGINNSTDESWMICGASGGAIYLGKARKMTIPTAADVGLRPSETKACSLGHGSYLWKAIYNATTSISTSDRKQKKDIRTFDCNENYEKLFFDLKPVVYKFIDGESNRDHFGYISQDVEESLYKLGFNDKSFAGFCRDVLVDEDDNPILDENGEKQWNYALRYQEFISLNTYMIQKAYNRINELENKNAEYEERISKLEKIIEGLCA